MREDVHLVAAVVLIGEATRDHSRIDELVATGVLVILIPDRGTDQGLFPDAEGPGRAAWSSDSPQGIEGLLVDLTQHRAFWGGLELTLSERELAMLASLCADPGRARSFADLAEPGGGQYFGDRERVHSAIKRLRKKLADAGVLVTIQSVSGYGYRLCSPGLEPREGSGFAP